jgi:1-acyl-sn-glycerol-3-phosphate acyltransferase
MEKQNAVELKQTENKTKIISEHLPVIVFQTILYWPIYLFLKFIFGLQIDGQENLNNTKNKALIFAGNHCHWLDGTIGGHSLPRKIFAPLQFIPLRFVVAQEYFNFIKSPIPFPLSLIAALYVKANGSIPIWRDKKENLESKLKSAVEALNNNQKIWIFLESKISKDGDKQKGKRDIGYLHKTTKTSIVPVALINTYQCTSLKNLIQFLLRKKRIKVIFGKPIIGLEKLEIEKIAERVMNEIDYLLKINLSLKETKHLDIKFEQHNFFIKIFRIFLVPLINNLPEFYIKKILAKTTKDSKDVLNRPGTTHALETLYTIHHRKKEIFKRGIFNGILTLFWHNFLSQPKAVRNRLSLVEKILKDRIQEIIKNNIKEIKILSIGGGSCRAIIQAIKSLEDVLKHNGSKVTLQNIDKHLEVLELTKKIIKDYKLNSLIEFIGSQGSAKKIEDLKINDKFDIVEIVGLLDYFNDEEATKLLKYTYDSLLANNGLLIWANIKPNNEMKFLKNIGWPSMYYRNLTDIIYLIKNYLSNLNKNIIIYQEPLGVHWIIVTKK